jgi:predicted alpha/beta-fold hydrolase
LQDTTDDEERFFEVEPGCQVLAHCRWQSDRAQHPTLVMWHGLEGSAVSTYMLTTATKVFRRGFNVVRMNVRNCGGTEHLTPTLYHGGLTTDLRVVIEELIANDGLSRIVIAGFSLGGNMVLKLAGEYGDSPPPEIKAVGAISPSIDLSAGRDFLNLRRNLVYQKNFLFYLKRRLRRKEKLYPGSYDVSALNRVRSIEQFDDRFIAPAFGFEGVDDYYRKASSRPYIGRIRIPTLIIHAKDDPFIPFEPLTDPSIEANPFVLVAATEKGGHVAFVSANLDDEDRFWAENRLVDFCEIVAS